MNLRPVLLVSILLAASAPAAQAHHGVGGHALAAASEAPAGNATLALVLNTTGGDGSLTVDLAVPGAPSRVRLDAENGTANATIGSLPAGNGSLAPVVPGGWRLAASACDRGTPANVTLVENATTTCWFDTEGLATLVVRALATGANATFSFSASGPGLPAGFDVAVRNGSGEVRFAELAPHARYRVQALALAGWSLANETCAASFTLAPGETRTCAATYVPQTTLRVQVLARGGEGTFPFLASGAGLPETFSLVTENGTAAAHFPVRPAENVTVRLQIPSAWVLESGSCEDVAVPADGTRTCAFVVAKRAELRATLGSFGGDATFTLRLRVNESAPVDLPLTTSAGRAWLNLTALDPYAYHRLTLVAPHGWRVTSAPCANVTPGPGAVVSCDFRAALPDAPAPPPPRDDDAAGARPGGGLGYWKNWDNHHAEAQVDAWVARVAADSAWLMPSGYAATADGMRALLVDASKGCGRGRDDACLARRVQAELLVLRLNLEVGRVSWSDERHVGGEAARQTGLEGTKTLREIVSALEARAPASLAAREAQAWRSLLGGAG